SLGNIEVCQQFHPRHNRSRELSGHTLHRLQDPVDAITNVQPVLERFEMNIRGPEINHPVDDGTDQPDHRRFSREIAEMLYEIGTFAAALPRILLSILQHEHGAPESLLDVALQT